MQALRASTAAAIVSLTSCSFAVTPFLINNSGHEATIFYVRDRDHPERKSKLRLTNGEGESFSASDRGFARVVIISTAECTAEYIVPSVLDLHGYWKELQWDPAEYHLIRMQLEPDFKIHLLPPDAKHVIDVRLVTAIQQAGFPLQPSKLNCDERDRTSEIQSPLAPG